MPLSRLNMYATLLHLPLFQGMSRSDLTDVVGQTRFDFTNAGPGTLIAAESHPAHDIVFLLKGTMTASASADDHSYRLTEELDAPWMIQPESLYGLTQSYSRTFTSTGQCQLLRLSKDEVTRLSNQYDIFRINLLNILTTRIQKQDRRLWHVLPTTPRGKLSRFLADRCLHPSGHKVLEVKMTTLGHLLGESRLNISHTLSLLAGEQLLSYSRGRIDIPQLERLLTAQ